MRTSMKLFVALGLALAIGLATAISPFASPDPDGLEKVAEEKAFLEDGKLAPNPGGLPDPRLRLPGHRERARPDRRGRIRRHLGRVRGQLRCRLAAAQAGARRPRWAGHDRGGLSRGVRASRSDERPLTRPDRPGGRHLELGASPGPEGEARRAGVPVTLVAVGARRSTAGRSGSCVGWCSRSMPGPVGSRPPRSGGELGSWRRSCCWRLAASAVRLASRRRGDQHSAR